MLFYLAMLLADAAVVVAVVGVDVQNVSPHVWGDVDCGGEVTPVDSLKLLRFDAGLSVQLEAGCPLLGSAVLVQVTLSRGCSDETQ